MLRSARWSWLVALRERRFALGLVKRLSQAYSTVRASRPGLAGDALYREVLLHSGEVTAEQVDEIMDDAEQSVDAWTAAGRTALGFRELVHFVVMVRHRAAGNAGAVVSFGAIVDATIPEHW